MATLGVTFTGAALSMGGKKAEDPTTPPINAKSPDEENFVKCVPHFSYTSIATQRYLSVL
jgi:F-type H+-transporting ATPase subunit k